MEMFCESAVTYARGVLPHEGSDLSPQQLQEFNEANILKKVHVYKLTVLCCHDSLLCRVYLHNDTGGEDLARSFCAGDKISSADCPLLQAFHS